MSLEKCCNFYPNNFKFCIVKKNYKESDVVTVYVNSANTSLIVYSPTQSSL